MEQIDRLRKQLEGLNDLNLSSLGLHSFRGLEERDFGFFPGGNGLVDGRQATTFPYDGTVILGSNFGSTGMLDDQNRWLEQDERSGPTWSRLRKLLMSARIDEKNCFFTNAWPFLHVGDGNVSRMIDRWLGDDALTAGCVRFFESTVKEVHPRLIIALGTGPAAFLSWVWQEHLAGWRRGGWKVLYRAPTVKIEHSDSTIVCTVITHPSMPNSWRRCEQYKGWGGEVELLARAARLAVVTIPNRP